MRAPALAFFSLLITGAVRAAEPTVVIYNGGFALVHQPLDLDLRAGENEIRTSDVTRSVDPASVMLRDPAGKAEWRLLEQRYRSEPISERALLAQMEGQSITFQVHEGEKTRELQGKLLRAHANGHSEIEAMVEIDGKLRFGLPGTPLFPGVPADSVLKPELRLRVTAPRPLKAQAELSYLTEGFHWNADYNAVMREDRITEFSGWVTLKNDTTTDFPVAQVKLVAGDVKRLTKGEDLGEATTERVAITGSYIPGSSSAPGVQARTFDEYHEYLLPRAVALPAGESTQMELVQAKDVTLTRSYVYDGANLNLETTIYDAQLDAAFGSDSNSKVILTSEFKNDSANHLGVPLPRGRLHFYRYDADGRLQFTGDSAIDNTPVNEMVRATTGTAFDL
ncbi:MAG: hypothetical protein M3Y80_10155, partial [Verrucomicrobiota bacterium]|nr:hypothetical protein [Verrucomicrobiota bacterium]